MFNRPPPWAVQLMVQVAAIQQEVKTLMSLVTVDQATLDSLATNLEAVKTALAAEIASLQTQLPAADLSGLNAALSDLTALEPPAPTS